MASEVPPKPKMVVYGGDEPPRRRPPKSRKTGSWWSRRRTWVKVLIVGGSSLAAVLLIVAAVGAYYLNSFYDKVTSLTPDAQKASKKLVAPAIQTSDSPLTLLVIGSDHRGKAADGTFGLSDTMMLIRIDPKHHAAALFSIPRDLWVTVPGYGTGKINGAYSVGGDSLSLKAVEAATGVKPNYLVNVDFSGFRDIVNALGGIYVQVDQYYYNPASVAPYSGYSEIDVQPGYQQLSGRDALAFSRYRHTDDDFHREARQQTFLRAFEARASTRFHGVSVTDIPDISRLLDAVSSSMTIAGPTDNGKVHLTTLIKLVATAYGVRQHIASVRAPFQSVMEGDASAVDIDPAALKAAIYQWKHPWLLENAGASLPSQKPKKPRHTKPSWKPSVTPSSVTVNVLNGNGVTGASSRAAAQLRGWEYKAMSGGNAPNYKYQQDQVYYSAGNQTAANDIAHIMGHANVAALPSNVTSNAAVTLVVGKQYAGKLAVNPPRTATNHPTGPPSTISSTSEFKQAFAEAKHKVHFRVLYPTVSQASSQFCPTSVAPTTAGLCPYATSDPIRTYNLPAAGHGANSLYAAWKLPGAGDFWGIEETKFVDAPILQNPNATRKLDGRTYQFYFNGAHIQTIGIVHEGIAYWVQNSLTDQLTNAEMIAIARSLKPV